MVIFHDYWAELVYLLSQKFKSVEGIRGENVVQDNFW